MKKRLSTQVPAIWGSKQARRKVKRQKRIRAEATRDRDLGTIRCPIFFLKVSYACKHQSAALIDEEVRNTDGAAI